MDVFISYRRNTGASLCGIVRELLKKKKIDVFFDKDNIRSEQFPERIKKGIDSSPNFLMILTPGYFVKREGIDRVREEILYAVEKKKKFILVYSEEYDNDEVDWENEQDEIKQFENFNRIKYESMSSRETEFFVEKIIKDMVGHDGLPYVLNKKAQNNSYYTVHSMDEADFLWIRADHTVCKHLDWSILEKAITTESIFENRDNLNLLVYKAYDIETYAKKYALNPKTAGDRSVGIDPEQIYGVTYRGLIEEANEVFGEGHFIPDEFDTENYIEAVKMLMKRNNIQGFDIIDLTLILKDVLEPEKTLRELSKLLNPQGGIIYIRELDDDYVDAYPDEKKLIPKLKELLELDEGAGNRHLGKKIYTYLIRSGADKVYISDEILSTANHKTNFQLAISYNYFSYLLPELKTLSEDTEENRNNPNFEKYVDGYRWLRSNYDDVESMFCSPEFYFRAGYIAGYGVFMPDEELY